MNLNIQFFYQINYSWFAWLAIKIVTRNSPKIQRIIITMTHLGSFAVKSYSYRDFGGFTNISVEVSSLGPSLLR